MRRLLCVPMIMLLLLLTACSGADRKTDDTDQLRTQYLTMSGCTATAIVSCEYDTLLWTAELRCEYVPDGESVIEVLAPETIAGVRGLLRQDGWYLEYEDTVLAVDTLGNDSISPMTCLPRMMHALTEGWILEENRENWGETPCVRLSLDESLPDGKKVITTLWLQETNGTPLYGEIAFGNEIILTAEFTQFAFYDKINNQESAKS